ncbi:unnamed protein product [Cutaneotrichosporon oleaginosum]
MDPRYPLLAMALEDGVFQDYTCLGQLIDHASSLALGTSQHVTLASTSYLLRDIKPNASGLQSPSDAPLSHARSISKLRSLARTIGVNDEIGWASLQRVNVKSTTTTTVALAPRKISNEGISRINTHPKVAQMFAQRQCILEQIKEVDPTAGRTEATAQLYSEYDKLGRASNNFREKLRREQLAREASTMSPVATPASFSTSSSSRYAPVTTPIATLTVPLGKHLDPRGVELASAALKIEPSVTVVACPSPAQLVAASSSAVPQIADLVDLHGRASSRHAYAVTDRCPFCDEDLAAELPTARSRHIHGCHGRDLGKQYAAASYAIHSSCPIDGCKDPIQTAANMPKHLTKHVHQTCKVRTARGVCGAETSRTTEAVHREFAHGLLASTGAYPPSCLQFCELLLGTKTIVDHNMGHIEEIAHLTSDTPRLLGYDPQEMSAQLSPSFCPICLFSPDLPPETRVYKTIDRPKQCAHIVSHLCALNPKDLHRCAYPACEGTMTLTALAEHYMSFHGHRLNGGRGTQVKTIDGDLNNLKGYKPTTPPAGQCNQPYDKWTVKALREACQARNTPGGVRGTKAQLVGRLVAQDNFSEGNDVDPRGAPPEESYSAQKRGVEDAEPSDPRKRSRSGKERVTESNDE